MDAQLFRAAAEVPRRGPGASGAPWGAVRSAVGLRTCTTTADWLVPGAVEPAGTELAGGGGAHPAAIPGFPCGIAAIADIRCCSPASYMVRMAWHELYS